ncbi:unnamed protein product [Brassicogethes aeneus]|uniref:Uncharacterized protein n=1 Tax=Brassicogethes aeneus TaxID=1431903 RepID=A0A9P0AU64_BRAAE|nr:unnamed protein product [Brassicogethes aeneus]
MRSSEVSLTPKMDNEGRRASLSIVIDDFDSKNANDKEERLSPEVSNNTSCPKTYTRKNSDASIKKILEEAENRKHEFWKLIDEHNAVVEDIKRIEKLEGTSVCKVATSPIKI